MEGKRFDELSRAVASMTSRRGVLRGIVGGAIASLVGGIGLRSAEAGQVKRGFGDICRKPGDCASNSCTPDGTGRSRCACATSSTLCNGACCQTYCDPQAGCVDSFVNIPCFDQCESDICFGMNNYFNYTFNSSYPCDQFCANQCWIIT